MAEQLKNVFFQRPFFEALADRIKQAFPPFDKTRFLALVFNDQWDDKALKRRMRHATSALGATLPSKYSEALAILLEVEQHFEPGFDHLLFSDFVECYGLENFVASMRALQRFTRSSAEFAIRPFIERYPERAMKQMLRWSKSRDEKVRRLASEGCRPRLPWGRALGEFKRDPSPILPILENLREDPCEDVRRSVANNIGDIAKDNLDLALDLAERWLAEKPATQRLLKHALRGPLKKGVPRTLKLFGLGEAQIKVTRFRVDPKRIPLGDSTKLQIRLRSSATSNQTLRLEYAVSFVRPTGKASRKVFQIRQLDLAAAESLSLKRKLDFQDRSTRKHYPGRHVIELIVNGKSVKRTILQLA